jgi:membrane associated rhomboid family serine protease
MATCYRHPSRETGVSCSNCGNPICPDCMTATPVGMRCPDCARQKTPTRSLQSMHVEPIATFVLIALNVAVFFGVRSSPQSYLDLVLFANGSYGGELHGVAQGEWWRLVTSGFVHVEYWHIGMNMLSLYWLGRLVEPALGHPKFVAIYVTSLLTGSLGVLILDPNSPTLGASGAIYGLLGAAIVMARNRSVNLMESGLVPILAINLGLTFFVSGISIGGHIGGLIGGLIAAFAVEQISMRRRNAMIPAVAACVVLAVAAVAASVVVAGAA